ncbi:DUF3429 domain-containing protein [Teredinibacter sp. KSP-S5-2]|uniref:DUF3429 domain-containing protein n=1 Tax=Teredinibacter sp. KSP-S5-2 TaxID=3034506 RepID=UPI0029342068|nr:DUF3429 domain-containing protein [Teredinibacter sp. KSP-S5-2]WNO07525.1 DUF3429 domain-containing protein [Teredinibacter sp. KSP-S5-2]
MNHIKTVTDLFGFLGLLPFIAYPLYVLLLNPVSTLIDEYYTTYGLAIICFMTGTWWGQGLAENYKPIVVSALLFALALVCYLLFYEYWLLIGGILLLLLFALERFTSILQGPSVEYQKLRFTLTLGTSSSLVLSHFVT